MAGPDAPGALPPILLAWLTGAERVAATHPWVLRGSAVIWARCPQGRVPADLDYVVPGDRTTFDPGALTAIARAVADVAALELVTTEGIWAETTTPGLRVSLRGAGMATQVDLAVGDPMAVAPRPLVVDGASALACALETLFGWKLHGLCEFGAGRWRAKDLFDLDLLWRTADLDRQATRAEVHLAFASRGLSLSALDDFRTRQSWGTSRSSRRKWDALAAAHAPTRPFFETRAAVRAAVAELLGPYAVGG